MPRSFLFIFLLGFCGGLLLAEFWRPLPFVSGGALAAAGLCLTQRKLRLIALVVWGVGLGLWRWSAFTAVTPMSLASLAGQTRTLEGTIHQAPTVRDQQQRVILAEAEVDRQRYHGQLQVSLPRYPTFEVGQRLTVRCEVTVWPETRRWRQWSHGLQAQCYDAAVLAARLAPRSWRISLGRIQESVVKRINRNFVDPQASLLSGILLGSQDGMPAELVRNFQATGTTHIIALSGFNVTIIMNVVSVWLIKLFGRRWAWGPSLGLVILFVIMTGASASVVRAAIMALIGSVSLWFGRPVAAGRLLGYTALTMLFHNPLILLHDLGFQLSFLATTGLMFFSGPLSRRLTWVTEKFGWRENLATTLAAILLTEPLLLWQFGRVSLIAPLVNAVVLPFIPVAMALGGLWLLAAMVHPLLGQVGQPAADATLRLVVTIIRTGAHAPTAQAYLAAWPAVAVGMGFVFTAVYLKTHENQTAPA